MATKRRIKNALQRWFGVNLHATGILAVLVALATGVLLAPGPVYATTTTISVSPSLTFFLTNNDPVGPSIPIDLLSIGLNPGDIIRLEQLGDFAAVGPQSADTAALMMGVFSASNMLLSSSTLNRVSDAVDAGNEFASPITYFGGLSTDIPQDFAITDTMITIPTNATYLFVAPYESYLSDNSDPDGDYAIRISKLFMPPDHYRCYTINPPTEIDKMVTLEDQFKKNDARVIKSKFLCAPVSKNGEPVSDLNGIHLEAYEIQDPPLKPQPKVRLENQFGTEETGIKMPLLLLVPTTKKVL